MLGASGFVGSHLVERFKKDGTPFFAPGRGDPQLFARPLGHVIYCIGLTADFRKRPLDAAEAHVSVLVDVLRRAKFDSLLYLSSTRVYEGAASTDELAPLTVSPANPNHVFNLTKLAGEAVCLSQERKEIRVARLSNVLGPDFASENFVFSVLRDMIRDGHVTLRTTPDSAKDYVRIDDLVGVLPRVAAEGRERVYNVASGANLTNQALLEKLARLTGATFEYGADAKKIAFAPIAVGRIQRELGFRAGDVPGLLDELYPPFRAQLKRE